MIDDPLNRNKVKRGVDLPHAKLDEEDIRLIFAAVEERKRLRDEANRLSNKALAEKFGVHVRTIDKVTAYETWTHIV